MKNPLEMTLAEVIAYFQLHGCTISSEDTYRLIEEVKHLQKLDKTFQVVMAQKQIEQREKPVTIRQRYKERQRSSSYRKLERDFDNVPCEVINSDDWNF